MPVYTYTTFDDPLNTSGDGTLASGINDTGHIVGTYADASGVHGFLLSGGIYITLDAPLAPQRTLALGLNDAGQIVGGYVDASGTHGFLYSGGIYITLDDPLATNGTNAIGINNTGQIVGNYTDNTGAHGFVETTVPNPAPPAATTADLILRGSSASPAVAGQYQIYDIGNNAILAGYALAQIGTDWQF